MSSFRRVAFAFALVPVLFAGCKSSDKPAQTTTKATRLFAVKVESASFFQRGPRPGGNPDLKLPKDTVVKLIRPSFGYSKVELVTSGQQGYVASEEIGPAPSTLLASATISPADSATFSPADPATISPADSAVPTTGPAGEQFNLNSDDPRLVPPPEQLPAIDLPAPAPEP